jgi:oligoribonuclease NrnB/cAMP/cGMP phosphodiesterase (DHH superfamily)
MVYSLTHEVDLDGLGSQAILKRCFSLFNKNSPTKFKKDFAYYTNFASKIKDILTSELPNKLIITDIGFNKDFVSLFPLFKKAAHKGLDVYWFDHHLIEKRHKNELEKLLKVYLNDPGRCGAEIVKEYYLPNDRTAIEIAKFAKDIDFRRNQYELAENLQSIISFNRGKKKHLQMIVDYLSMGQFENKWLETQLKKSREWEKLEKVKINKNLRKIHINNSYDLIISTASIGGGKITKYLQKNYPSTEIYLGIDNRFNEVIVYSDIIDCRKLAQTFQGGGHKNRAGFHHDDVLMTKNQVNPKFLNQIKDWINYSIN